MAVTKGRPRRGYATIPVLVRFPATMLERIAAYHAQMASQDWRLTSRHDVILMLCERGLQVVNVSLLIRTLLLFENLDVLVGFPFVWTEQQEVGFPRTLGIGDNDVRRDGRFHDNSPSLLLRDGRPSMFDAVMGWG